MDQPMAIVRSADLSSSAKLLYADLLAYAEGQKFCSPSQEQMAQDLAVADRTIRIYLRELAQGAYVKVYREGLQRPNTYELLDLPSSPAPKKTAGPNRKLPDWKSASGEVRTGTRKERSR